MGLRFSQLRADINKVCLVFVHMKIQQKEGKEKRPVRIDDQDVRKARSMQIARRSAVLSLTCGLAGTKPPPAVCPRLLCRACSTRATFFSLFPERLSSLLAVDTSCPGTTIQRTFPSQMGFAHCERNAIYVNLFSRFGFEHF